MNVKQRLANGKACIGSWITLGHPAIAELMAKAGFDWLAVDMEHTTIGLAQAGELIRAIDLAGAEPFVRLTDNDPMLIKRVMDAGAKGLIVPMVNSAEEARAAYQAMHYPPTGTRGVGLARAQGYGASFAAYKESLATETTLIVQIEHIKAVENLESILAVEGVDGFMVGPYDLSASLGRPGDFDHPQMIEAMKVIDRVGGASGKALGIHVVEPDFEMFAERLSAGYTFVAFSLDIRMLDITSRRAVALADKIRHKQD